MARWPIAGSVYPVTPKAYPASPKAYPGSGIAAFPSGVSEWNPASLASATLALDLDARKGITFRNTLQDCSATTDPISLSGTLGPYTTTPHDIRVEIVTGGVPGTATMRVSLNSGHDYIEVSGSYIIPVPAGLTYAIPGTLINLVFTAITYNANAIYIGQIESWTDQSPNAYVYSRQTANFGFLLQKMGRTNNGFNRLSKGVMGRWAMCGDANHVMQNATGAATAIAGGANNSFHVFIACQMDAIGAGAQTLFSFGRSSVATPFLYVGETGATSWAGTWNSDGGVAGNANGGTSNTRAALIEFEYDGTNSYLRINGTQVGTNAVAHGTLTLDINSIMALVRTTVANRAKASITRIVAYLSNLSAGDATTARTQLRSIHDIVTPKTVRVSYKGDSFYDSSRGNGAAPNVMLHGNDTVTVVNAAATGATVAADNAAQTITVNANYSAGADKNVLFIHFGMNDLGTDGTGNVATLQANIAAMVAADKLTGWYVIFATFRTRNDSVGGPAHPNYTTKMEQMNAWIRAGSSGANAIYDDEAGAPGVLSDDLWYANDGAGHPTTPEASREADLMEAQYRIAVA